MDKNDQKQNNKEDTIVVSSSENDITSVPSDKTNKFDDEIIDTEIKKPNDENSKPQYRNLVLSGGSIKAISQIGAIKKLIDAKILNLKKLNSVAGSSAGSLVGLLVILGFGIDEIWDFIYCLDMKKLVDPDFLMFVKKCGIETGRTIHNLFEEILTKRTGIKHINFKQLYEITKIRFIVVGSCLTTKEAIYYDYINTPTFKVSMAIRISISMPGIFTPITINNKTYVDGGLLDNYPMHLFKDEMNDTIGIFICNDYDTDYKYPEEYFVAIMNLFLYHYYNKHTIQYSNNTVRIKEIPSNVFVFNFDIDNETKIKLYNCGVLAAEEFIKNLTPIVNNDTNCE